MQVSRLLALVALCAAASAAASQPSLKSRSVQTRRVGRRCVRNSGGTGTGGTNRNRRGGNNNNNNNGGGGNGGNNGGGGGGGGGGNIETSTTLDPAVIQSGSAQNGNPTNGQVASLMSTNNFINFCATSTANGAPLTNGTQTKSKTSCNPIPMGMIIGQNNMPSSKFIVPKNLDKIAANQDFTIQMKINNMVSGNFVNPTTNYYAAPAQVDASSGNIIGHSHFVVEAIDSLQSTTVTNPLQFAFFKGVDPPAKNGIMSVDVPGGLPAGTYRLASINAAANHQPVLVSIAQHGSLDDMVYFTVQ